MNAGGSLPLESNVTAPAEPTPVFEETDCGIVVHVDGEQVAWEDYVDSISEDAMVLGFLFWRADGGDRGSEEVHLVAPGVVVHWRTCEDADEQTLHEGVEDVGAFALDLIEDSDMHIVLATHIHGPLFDGNTSLPVPLLPMTPELTATAYGDDFDGSQFYVGECSGVAEEVCEEFNRRVGSGGYHRVSELLNAGSETWRQWVVDLLVSYNSSIEDLVDQYPMTETEHYLQSERRRRLGGLTAEELVEAATGALWDLRPGGRPKPQETWQLEVFE